MQIDFKSKQTRNCLPNVEPVTLAGVASASASATAAEVVIGKVGARGGGLIGERGRTPVADILAAIAELIAML